MPKPIPAAAEGMPKQSSTISILDVEDKINRTFSAMLLAYSFTEETLCRFVGDPNHSEVVSIACYSIAHAEEMMREVHAIFHQYMASEFAKRRAAA